MNSNIGILIVTSACLLASITMTAMIYEDNMSTILMLKGTYNHRASKHVNPKYHFSKSAIVDGLVSVEHLVTTEMEADMLTKALPVGPHWHFTRKVLNTEKDG